LSVIGPDQVRMLACEPLHVVGVVEQPPVGRASARHAGRRGHRGIGAVGLALLARLQREVRDLDRVVEVVRGQLGGVGGAVQHDVDEAGAAVLGHVQAQAVEDVLARGVRRGDAHQLLGGDLGRVDRRRLDAQAGARGAAREPAGLHDEALTRDGVAGGELTRPARGRPGDHLAVLGLEDGDVPVAGRGHQLRGHRARGRHGHGLLDVAGPRAQLALRARAIHRARNRHVLAQQVRCRRRTRPYQHCTNRYGDGSQLSHAVPPEI